MPKATNLKLMKMERWGKGEIKIPQKINKIRQEEGEKTRNVESKLIN